MIRMAMAANPFEEGGMEGRVRCRSGNEMPESSGMSKPPRGEVYEPERKTSEPEAGTSAFDPDCEGFWARSETSESRREVSEPPEGESTKRRMIKPGKRSGYKYKRHDEGYKPGMHGEGNFQEAIHCPWGARRCAGFQRKFSRPVALFSHFKQKHSGLAPNGWEMPATPLRHFRRQNKPQTREP